MGFWRKLTTSLDENNYYLLVGVNSEYEDDEEENNNSTNNPLLSPAFSGGGGTANPITNTFSLSLKDKNNGRTNKANDESVKNVVDWTRSMSHASTVTNPDGRRLDHCINVASANKVLVSITSTDS